MDRKVLKLQKAAKRKTKYRRNIFLKLAKINLQNWTKSEKKWILKRIEVEKMDNVNKNNKN